SYFFTVSALDAAGNAATDDNGGTCYTFSTPLEPGACLDSIIVNGSFEAGTFTGWTAQSSPGDQLQPWAVVGNGSGYFFNGTPLGGSFFAQNGFDGESGFTYDLHQEVSIPATTPSIELRWAERIQWDMVGYGATMPREYVV